MALLNYDKDINAIEFRESAALFLIINKELNNEIGKLSEIESIFKYFISLAKKDPGEYKKNMKKYFNTQEDRLYRYIKDNTTLKNNESILLLKSSICRFQDWFLLSDNELKRLQGTILPPVLDNDIQVFKDYRYKNNFIKQHEINRFNIEEFLGYQSDINIDKLVKDTDRKFYKLLRMEIDSFKRMINAAIRNGELYKRTTNKSASFYKELSVDVNSYIENMFSYDTNLKYYHYLNIGRKDLQFAKIEGNYDFIRCNLIKNKGLGTRFVFYTSTQVNTFLKPINDIFEKCFRSCKYIGTYNQDKAVRDMVNFIELNIDNDISILCLDASKYSDTLPISLIKHVLGLIIDDNLLVEAICECLNLPVLYNGDLVEHNATTQGVYFDFSIITLVNLYVQVAISNQLGKELLMANVVGDDSYLIIKGLDHETYGEVGREVWANFGCKINISKKVTGSSMEGYITYLKYYAEINNKEIINISGISPGLLFKNIHSYARLGAIVSYLKKSRYLDRSYIPINMLKDYYDNFKSIIKRAQASKILRLPKEEVEYIYDNALELMLNRPFLFGGYKDYNLNKIEDRRTIMDEVEDALRYIEYNFIDENNTIIPHIYEIKNQFNICNGPLDEDLNIFISEEFVEMYAKLIKFKKESKQFVNEGEGDVVEIRSIIKSLTDRRFDKYIPGGLTTDRLTNQPFEDKLLIAPMQKPIDISSVAYLPIPKDISQKNINLMISKVLSKERRLRGSYSNSGSRFINLDKYIITFSGSTTGEYITPEDWISKMKNARVYNNERWIKEMSEVLSAVYELTEDSKVISFVSEDYNRLYSIVRSLAFSCRTISYRYDKLKEIVDDYMNDEVRKYKEKFLKAQVKRWLESK